MGGKSSPDPPDYAAAAQQQGVANLDAARLAGKLNNPNIYTPLGQREVTFGSAREFDQNAYNAAMQDYQRQLSSSQNNGYQGNDFFGGRYLSGRSQAPAPAMPNRADYFYGGDGDQPVVRETLTPEGQRLFGQQMRISQSYGNIAEGGLDRVRQSLGQEFDPSTLPEIGDGIMERDLVTQSILDRYQPAMNQQRQQQEDNLLLQGQGRGGTAWSTAQRDMGQQENDARLAAILAGGQEQSRLYEMQSSERNRALQEALALRQLPLSEVNALRTGSQPTLPQFQPYQGQSVQPAPIFDATAQGYNAQLGGANAENAAMGNTLGTIGQLGAAAMFAFSDRRLKKDIIRIGEYLGLSVYLFKYIWSDKWSAGWMADEVMSEYPERVKMHESGYWMVNYGAI